MSEGASISIDVHGRTILAGARVAIDVEGGSAHDREEATRVAVECAARLLEAIQGSARERVEPMPQYVDGEGDKDTRELFAEEPGEVLPSGKFLVSLKDDDEPPGSDRVVLIADEDTVNGAYNWLTEHKLPRHLGHKMRGSMYPATSTLDEFKTKVRSYLGDPLDDQPAESAAAS